MHSRERRVLLRHYLEQGLSKSVIARMLGIGRRTLYHWINMDQLDRDLDNGPVRYKPRPAVDRNIDTEGSLRLACLSTPGSARRDCLTRSELPDMTVATLK